jgi:hypothetical protein
MKVSESVKGDLEQEVRNHNGAHCAIVWVTDNGADSAVIMNAIVRIEVTAAGGDFMRVKDDALRLL